LSFCCAADIDVMKKPYLLLFVFVIVACKFVSGQSKKETADWIDTKLHKYFYGDYYQTHSSGIIDDTLYALIDIHPKGGGITEVRKSYYVPVKDIKTIEFSVDSADYLTGRYYTHTLVKITTWKPSVSLYQSNGSTIHWDHAEFFLGRELLPEGLDKRFSAAFAHYTTLLGGKQLKEVF
jgi:hypothetical protein